MKQFPIAIQLFSVRGDLEKDFEGTLKQIKALGYDGVEFAGLYGKAPAEVKALCESIGLVPISAHVPFVDMMADPEKVLGDYAAIGCRYVAIPYLTEEYRPGTEGFRKTIEGARVLTPAMPRGVGALSARRATECEQAGYDCAARALDGLLTAWGVSGGRILPFRPHR